MGEQFPDTPRPSCATAHTSRRCNCVHYARYPEPREHPRYRVSPSAPSGPLWDLHLWLQMPPESDCRTTAQSRVVQRRWQSILLTPPATLCMLAPLTVESGNLPTPERLAPI